MPVVLNQIKSIEHLLSPVEKRITAVIINQPAQCTELSGRELAALAGVSESALIRFSQRIGFSGLRELKVVLAKELHLMEEEATALITKEDSPCEIRHKVFSQSRQALSRTEALLNMKQLEEAAHCLSASKCILIYSAGEAVVAATDLKLKLLSLGFMVELIQNMQLYDRLAQHFSVVFIISETAQLNDLEKIYASELKTILLSQWPDKRTDIHLLTSAEENINRLSPTAGRLVQLAVIDVLWMLLIRLQP
ncbi:MurR/RpiR family transcriptional regulator [Macrococcus carouselicus]|nr:MurR/RpiR family transcriptional regulator [Macrococcus carouselicus]